MSARRYRGNNCTIKVSVGSFHYGRKNWPGLLGMMLNPDVTVRGQGVMEKCSFCVQRIETARQPAKDEGRDIRDGEVLTGAACAPGRDPFGTFDKQQPVAGRARGSARHALQILNTRSAVTYLAQVRRDENGGH